MKKGAGAPRKDVTREDPRNEEKKSAQSRSREGKEEDQVHHHIYGLVGHDLTKTKFLGFSP